MENAMSKTVDLSYRGRIRRIIAQLERGLAGDKTELGYAAINLATLLMSAPEDPRVLFSLHVALDGYRRKTKGSIRRTLDLLSQLALSFDTEIRRRADEKQILEALRRDGSGFRRLIDALAEGGGTPRCREFLTNVGGTTREEFGVLRNWDLIIPLAGEGCRCTGGQHPVFRLSALGRSYRRRISVRRLG